MGKVVYLMNVSLDGYVETPDHSLDWGKVDDELHTWFAVASATSMSPSTAGDSGR